MMPTLYAHPFSSYCQKALIALYENDTAFQFRTLEDPGANAELAALWPMKRFPILVDEDRTILEASTIIEHLQIHYPGPTRFIPSDPDAAIEARMMDRVFDNYVMTPQGRIVFDHMRPEDKRDPTGVAEARAMLETAYAWLDDRMADREWACASGFSLADCAAAPRPVLRRLDPPDRSGLRQPSRLPRPAAGAAVVRPGSRRGSPIQELFSIGSAG